MYKVTLFRSSSFDTGYMIESLMCAQLYSNPHTQISLKCCVASCCVASCCVGASRASCCVGASLDACCCRKVCALDDERATTVANQAQSMGFALVGVWVQEVAEMYYDGLKSRDLVVDLSPEA